MTRAAFAAGAPAPENVRVMTLGAFFAHGAVPSLTYPTMLQALGGGALPHGQRGRSSRPSSLPFTQDGPLRRTCFPLRELDVRRVPQLGRTGSPGTNRPGIPSALIERLRRPTGCAMAISTRQRDR